MDLLVGLDLAGALDEVESAPSTNFTYNGQLNMTMTLASTVINHPIVKGQLNMTMTLASSYSSAHVSIATMTPAQGGVGTAVQVHFTGSGFSGSGFVIAITGGGVTLGSPLSLTDSSFDCVFTIDGNATRSIRDVTVTTTAGGTSNIMKFAIGIARAQVRTRLTPVGSISGQTS